MCRIMEEMILEDRQETALKMLESKKFSIEEISEFSRLTVDEVRQLAENKPA